MLIESYDLNINVSDHSAEVFEYEAIAHLMVDISEALPYLNATLPNGEYIADAPAFSWREGDHSIGFWSDRIAIDNLESREQARAMIEKLVALVNDVWKRRDEIKPDTTRRENLQPLELYKLLPKTNCKECGENSCFNFALKLAAGQKDLDDCKPMIDDESYKEQRDALASLVASKRALL